MSGAENMKTVVVTGFGPFGCHTINASWEAVKLLPSFFQADDLGVNLIIEEIPVEYDLATENLQRLWDTYHPLLMVHVGVSHVAKELTLETCASKHGYTRPDVKGKVPAEGQCCIGSSSKLKTKLNIKKLAKDLNCLGIGVKCCTSENAGLYLCEFSFYTSLCVSDQLSLFVHVPDISKPYNSEETARGLAEILHLAIIQLSEKCEEKEV